MSSVNAGTLIAQGLLLALELYRNHNGLSEDWVPTQEDWDTLESEVGSYTAQRFKDEAKAALPPGSESSAPPPVAETEPPTSGDGSPAPPP